LIGTSQSDQSFAPGAISARFTYGHPRRTPSHPSTAIQTLLEALSPSCTSQIATAVSAPSKHPLPTDVDALRNRIASRSGIATSSLIAGRRATAPLEIGQRTQIAGHGESEDEQ